MPLGKRTDFGDARYSGVEVDFAHDISGAMQEYLLCGFDFVVAPLVAPGHAEPPLALPGGGPVPARLRKEIMLTSASWGGQIVGKVSPWINPDAGDVAAAKKAGAALQQELSWAAFLGLQAVLLPAPADARAAFNWVQTINQALGGLTHMAVWLQMPMALPEAAQGGGDWFEFWLMVHALCEHSTLLGVALEVPADLPPQAAVKRWLAQPLKALILPTSVFTTNKRGYPVLSRAHQELVSLAYSHSVQVILTGGARHKVAPAPAPPPPATPAGDGEAGGAAAGDAPLPFSVTDPGESHALRPYWEYLCYIFRRIDSGVPQDFLEAGYRDYLQAPLQPLQDNLESQTYETFEKDVTKYACYQAAVRAALADRVPDADAAAAVTTLMVVGAGRGPLVRASLAAAREAGRRLRVYAVEKNPAAIVHIQAMVDAEGWADDVTIVAQDMRDWEPPEKADILVSELLGSFGDNELSPECLDGAQRLLKPDGISIPCSYTSFLAPVSTTKLHEGVRAYKDLEHWETPYVVKFHRYFELSPPQPVFTFTHPTPQPADNDRGATLTFPRPAADGPGVLHGFAGYFESVLYPGVTLNTHPPTHTPNMFSWFPIFFPLREPLPLPPGAPVVAHMWRKAGKHKVWYEWAVSAPATSAIHNPGGRSYWVGLYSPLPARRSFPEPEACIDDEGQPGTCDAGVCVCTPASCELLAGDGVCGAGLPDGCGGTLTCTACPARSTRRAEVTSAFTAAFLPHLDCYMGGPDHPACCTAAENGFPGSADACTPFQLPAGWQAETLAMVNFFRAMAGAGPVALSGDAGEAAGALAAALAMAAAQDLSHDPGDGWPCATAPARAAAAASNLALGAVGPQAVIAFMADEGEFNSGVGHRRWLLLPSTRAMAPGDAWPSPAPGAVPAHALWVVEDGSAGGPPAPGGRAGLAFTAWPPPGYVPYPLVFPRWHVSFEGLGLEAALPDSWWEADLFGTASVAMTARDAAGGGPAAVPLALEPRGEWDLHALSWRPALATQRGNESWMLVRPAAEVTYSVTISGLHASLGLPGDTLAYSVTVYAAGVPASVDEDRVPAAGGAQPRLGRGAPRAPPWLLAPARPPGAGADQTI
ncbi:PRMT5 [Scenedesmus sp. PABB004]|nr:PRMT5 [Scenedesmus sp. PABB004]